MGLRNDNHFSLCGSSKMNMDTFYFEKWKPKERISEYISTPRLEDISLFGIGFPHLTV